MQPTVETDQDYYKASRALYQRLLAEERFKNKSLISKSFLDPSTKVHQPPSAKSGETVEVPYGPSVQETSEGTSTANGSDATVVAAAAVESVSPSRVTVEEETSLTTELCSTEKACDDSMAEPWRDGEKKLSSVVDPPVPGTPLQRYRLPSWMMANATRNLKQ